MCSEEEPSCQSGKEGRSRSEVPPSPDLQAASQAAPPLAAGYLTGWGQYDSHAVTLSNGKTNRSSKAGKPYNRITWSAILARAKTPTRLPKGRAQFMVPSHYAEHDGRTHQVQRDLGQFGMLALDIDIGNHPLSEVQAAITAIVGPVEMLIYSSSSASEDNRKWRILLPLSSAVQGSDYHDTEDALFDLLEERGVVCDGSLKRPAQPVYLPNVPPERRDAHGCPLFYEARHLVAERLALGPDTAIARRRAEIRAERERKGAEAAAQQEEYKRQRLEHAEASGDDFEPIAHFNSHHTVADMLTRYGFEQSPRMRGSHWRSPLSESGSFATEDFGDYWVCVSAWAHNYNVGRVTKSGHRSGDAFDLYAHFDHGGDKRAAARAYVEAVRPPRQQERPPRTGTGRFTGQGSVAADPDTPPTFLKPAEVETQLKDLFVDALETAAEWHQDGKNGAAPVQVIKASAGSGKTTTALLSLANFELTRLAGDVIIYMPTLRLAAEAAEKAEDLGVGWHVTRGRSAENPETGEPMCARAELAEEAGKAGLSIQATLCEREMEDGTFARCPHHEVCSGMSRAEADEPDPGYLRQWCGLDDKPEVRFESHAYLRTNGDGSRRKTGLKIIDEKVWQGFTREGYLPVTDLENAGLRPPRRSQSRHHPSDYERRVAEAADRQVAGRAVVAALRAGTSPVLAQYSAEDFDAFAAAEDRRATILASPPSSSDADLAEAIGQARQDRDTAGLRAMLWRTLAHAKRLGREGIERLEFLPSWQGYSGKEASREAIHLRWLASFPADAPTILLDADAVPEVVERMHPGARIHSVDMEPRAEVIQVQDRTFSKQSLMAGKKLRGECVGVIRAEVARDRNRSTGQSGVLVVASKAVVRRLFEDAGALAGDLGAEEADTYMLAAELHGARWLWYGPGCLGLNEFKEFGTVIAIGREELPYDVLEGTARAIFGDHGEPLQLLDRDEAGCPLMPVVKVPYLMADGTGRAALVTAHPDPRVRALQGQARECSLRQAVERLRLARAAGPKRVLLLTKVPLPGFPVTRLVRFEEFAPPRLIAALHEARGVLRLSAAGLAADAPETFPTPKAAEHWLSRGGKSAVNTPGPLIGSYYRDGGVNSVLATMRLHGQRGGKPTPVLIAMPEDPRTAVEAQYGALAAFEIVETFASNMGDGAEARTAGVENAPKYEGWRAQKPARSGMTSSPLPYPPAEGPLLSPPMCVAQGTAKSVPVQPSTPRPTSEVAPWGAGHPLAIEKPASLQASRLGKDTTNAAEEIPAQCGNGPLNKTMPQIKPNSPAAKVLDAIKAGHRTPGAVALVTGLGGTKVYRTLKALRDASLIDERRNGEFRASNIHVLPQKPSHTEYPEPRSRQAQAGPCRPGGVVAVSRAAPELHLVGTVVALLAAAHENEDPVVAAARSVFAAHEEMDEWSPDAWT